MSAVKGRADPAAWRDAGVPEEVISALLRVNDPELPGVNVIDLGIVRDVTMKDGRVQVTITPTYSGCPAMKAIEFDIMTALATRGFEDADVVTVLDPPWTTDWITETGHAALRRLGISPPPKAGGRSALFEAHHPSCPHCGSANTEEISAFGATSCKSLHRCLACREPFEAFKCH